MVYNDELFPSQKLKRSCRDRQGEFIRRICSWNHQSDQRDRVFSLEPHQILLIINKYQEMELLSQSRQPTCRATL